MAVINHDFSSELKLTNDIMESFEDISELLIQNKSLIGKSAGISSQIINIASAINIFPKNLIVGYNGGISCLDEVNLLWSLGFDLVSSSTMLSTSKNSPKSILPNYPNTWMLKQIKKSIVPVVLQNKVLITV